MRGHADVSDLQREMVKQGLLKRGGRNLYVGEGGQSVTRSLVRSGVKTIVVTPGAAVANNWAAWDEVRRSPVDTVTCVGVLSASVDRADRDAIIRSTAGAIKPRGVVGFQVAPGPSGSAPLHCIGEISRWFDYVVRKGDLYFASVPLRRPRGRLP